MSEIKEFFGSISLLTSDWFYGLLALLWGFFVFNRGQREKIEADKSMALQKYIENNFNMKNAFLDSWTKFIALPEDSKEIFQMEYKSIKDENTRALIMKIIIMLHDVHVYHQLSKTSLEENMIWKGTYSHVFDEDEHKAFIEAFRKKQKANELSPEFVEYVEEIIKTNKQSTKNVEKQKAS